MQATSAPDATAPDELARDLYAVVVFLHRNCNADLLEAVAELDLTLTQIKLLHALEDSPQELSLKAAAECVHVSLPAASRLVDDLVRRGYVFRHADAADRRMKRVSLSEAGRQAIQRLAAARFIGLRTFAETLDPREREALAVVLELLQARPEIAAHRPDRDPDIAHRPDQEPDLLEAS